ncbi:MAG: hypothetical protein CME85_00895 [Henriciella sp.]|jgi:hypothetical protein|uniref:hypothetical protein n=1 Tax=uncultured Henriciella sp. TaxID=1608424 RepID=UPI000C642BDF|nr:hypothetical protein [Henriciella sp.]MAN73011.1 hypothetical protein [Henriciella sp.]MBF34339.1 hypothetical protein [Hyphomonadaceae bacterium]MBK74032.1 hypothetical protein [Henriciella sp.]|tara:strand:- start:50 stop:259 length:210 start_codon:yes stop_codon:yes gene_type:complete
MTSGDPAELADMSGETFPAALQLEPGRPDNLKRKEQDKSRPEISVLALKMGRERILICEKGSRSGDHGN